MWDAELEFWPWKNLVVEVAAEQGGVSAVVAQGYVMQIDVASERVGPCRIYIVGGECRSQPSF